MLILSRKFGERIRISDDIVVALKEIKGNRGRIGIEAPKSVCVLLRELAVTTGKTSPSC